MQDTPLLEECQGQANQVLWKECDAVRKFYSLFIIMLMLVVIGFIASAIDVFVFENRLIVLDEKGLAVYDLNGNNLFSLSTSGFARVMTAKDRLILIDNSGVRLFDLNGNQEGNNIAINRSPRVLIINDSIVIVDAGRIRIFDVNANQKGSDIATEGAVSVKSNTDGLMVIDSEDRVRLYDLEGLLLSNIQLPLGDRPAVTSIDFPSTVPANRTAVQGSLQFEDQNGDVDFDFFSPVEATNFLPFGFVTQVSGVKKGAITFTIACFIPQAITANVMLVDKEHHTSIPKEFSFVCQ